MERLTKQWGSNPVVPCNFDLDFFFTLDKKTLNGLQEIFDRLAAYEDTGLEPEQVLELKSFTQGGIHKIDDGWKHVQELLQAEQDGRLVVLPSKTVWELTMDAGPDCDLKCPVDAYDEALGCDLCSKAKPFAYERPCTPDLLKGLGKTVFLTREEAEAALKETRNSGEQEGQKQL